MAAAGVDLLFGWLKWKQWMIKLLKAREEGPQVKGEL